MLEKGEDHVFFHLEMMVVLQLLQDLYTFPADIFTPKEQIYLYNLATYE